MMKWMVAWCALALVVPAVAAEPTDTVVMPSTAKESRLWLDTATADQLAGLDEVDLGLAKRIVALRTARGGISNVEALRVLGISESALMSIRRGTGIRVALTVADAGGADTPEAVLSKFDHEPDVRMVQVWASEYAKVQPELVQRWLRASKAFGALPRVRAAYQLDDDWQNDFRRYDQFGNAPTSNVGEFSDVQTDADVGQNRRVLVEVIWYLYDIVMSPEQLRMISESQDMAKLREKILGEVTRLYFERRRLQVDVLLNPKSDLLGQVKDELRLRELSANLDALTGGRFSESIVKPAP